MNARMLHQRTITWVFNFRALALVIAFSGIGELRAQPFDTLFARVYDLPVDT